MTFLTYFLSPSFLQTGNVFVTYSSDISAEIVLFTDFLTKRGFQPAVRCSLLTLKKKI